MRQSVHLVKNPTVLMRYPSVKIAKVKFILNVLFFVRIRLQFNLRLEDHSQNFAPVVFSVSKLVWLSQYFFLSDLQQTSNNSLALYRTMRFALYHRRSMRTRDVIHYNLARRQQVYNNQFRHIRLVCVVTSLKNFAAARKWF